MRLTNRWNRFVYRLWSPIYDGLFDRFFAAPGRRRLVNLVTTLAGTDVTRRLGDMAPASRFIKVHDEPSLLRGAYRVILIQKPVDASDGSR